MQINIVQVTLDENYITKMLTKNQQHSVSQYNVHELNKHHYHQLKYFPLISKLLTELKCTLMYTFTNQKSARFINEIEIIVVVLFA